MGYICFYNLNKNFSRTSNEIAKWIISQREEENQSQQSKKSMRYFLVTKKGIILNITEPPPQDKKLRFWKH